MERYLITRRKLLSRGFCDTQMGVGSFTNIWPKGAPFELKTFLLAHKYGLDVFFVFREAMLYYDSDDYENVIDGRSKHKLWSMFDAWKAARYSIQVGECYAPPCQSIPEIISSFWRYKKFREVLRKLVAEKKVYTK